MKIAANQKANTAAPTTDRGRKTRRKLLDAATREFGEKGFHAASVSSITRSADVALGTFYTYFTSKEAIFKALVRDFSDGVRVAAAEGMSKNLGALDREQAATAGFLGFARTHKEIYRIIDEAEFVDPDSYRAHYESTAKRILTRLEAGVASGDLRDGVGEAHAWAVMGMNVFLGLRYAVWAQDADDSAAVAGTARDILARGLSASAAQ
ncbi:MAG: TetR/AcrR family transcriptional regulator [Parerythrobacter sp.]